MGIKKLNSFLLNICTPSAISRVPLNKFKGKTMVIDTSIYLYKYLSEDAFLDSFYSMLSIFKQYQIIPLFVFDGKPPVEKTEVLFERAYRRKDAEEKYKEMLQAIETQSVSDTDKLKQIENLAGLKRQFVRVTDHHIQNLKQLFTNLNIQYVDAPSEADVMCAYLVRKGIAYACISDDMDMFAYDCPIIIRKLSLVHHNCMIYNIASIKKDLRINHHFQNVLLLCGTDYKTGVTWDIQTAIERYTFYESEFSRNQTTKTFYEWILERRFVDQIQKDKLDHVHHMFQIPDTMPVTYAKTQVDWKVLQPILEGDGFIYAN